MLAALRSQVNLTTVLTLAFVAYMSASLRNLYRVAVPAIPSVLAPDGSHKPTLESLWLRSPGITFNISLGTSQHPKQSGDLLVLHRHGVPFNWKLGFEVDLQLDIEQESKDSTTLVGRCAAADLTPACSAAASDWTARHPKIDADAAAADGATSLVVGRWTGPDAAHIVRALRRGKPVYLHAVVAWDNIRDGPGGEFAALRGTSATTNLVESVRYVPPRALRYLWRDPWGDLLRAELAAADNSTSGFRIPAAKGGGSVLPVPEEPWPHWVGQADIGLIMDTQPFPREEIPQQIDGYLRKDIARTVYAPLMAVNAVRPTRERYHPLNVSFPSLPLRLRVVPMPIGQWQLMRMLDASITTQKSIGASDKDTDDVIRLLAETPLWLLGITFVVSFIHILFDALAIKNDVSFWAAAKTLRGISVRSLSISFVSNVVITLYLWEEGSSMLVLIPQAGNTVLLLWKIAKASGFVCATRYRVVPWLVYDAALHASATAGMTSAADSEAMHFLLLMIGPWVCGFAVYALLYQISGAVILLYACMTGFVGWRDYALTTAVATVYSTGFALMLPQVWINYKLKSVAALPWRVGLYRFGNTIIDDLFALIIKMPTMHRVSVFRDDVVFVVYMYQRFFLYPVDHSRAAEGFDDDDDSRAAEGKKAAVKAAAVAALPKPPSPSLKMD